MNGYGFFLSTSSNGNTTSLKNNCDQTTGRYLMLDATLPYPSKVNTYIESLKN